MMMRYIKRMLARKISRLLLVVVVYLLVSVVSVVKAIETDGQAMTLDVFSDLVGIALGRNVVLHSELDINARVYGIDPADNLVDVLDAVIKANGLYIQTVGNVVYIYPFDENARPDYGMFPVRLGYPRPTLADDLRQLFAWLETVHNAPCSFVTASPLAVHANCPLFIKDAVQAIAGLFEVDVPQYVVRAYIIETSSISAQELGFRFGYQGSRSGVVWNPQPDIKIDLGNASIQANFDDFALFGRWLARESGVSMVSQPMLAVDAGMAARIHVGNNVPIVVRAATTEQGASIERRDVGVILDVLPVQLSAGRIHLTVKTDVSRVDEVTNQFGAIISSRAIDTTITLQEGQTVVLGGLIDYYMEKSSQGVPVLRSIPLIGRAFRGDLDNADRREISVMLRIEPV
ncbi:type II secretion system protein GspD [Zobellella sp. An-6]|uniref:type II secretion system protein GspD n=1 Tax=Zobellella sp. An-6 TaxID=3400218 RepID=UPI0040433713